MPADAAPVEQPEPASQAGEGQREARPRAPKARMCGAPFADGQPRPCREAGERCGAGLPIEARQGEKQQGGGVAHHGRVKRVSSEPSEGQLT